VNVSYQRGRNDRRDGKPVKSNPYTLGELGYTNWIRGWQLQDAILKNDREYAYKLGRKDAKDGNTLCPYPVSTKAHAEWTRGQTEFAAAEAAKAEKAETANA
jgi:hypothetical protein